MPPPVLVTAATGNVGAPVVERLRSHGLPVRAAVHAAGLGDASGPDVESVRFGFTEEATWWPAFQGVRTMFLVRPPQIGNVRRDLLPAVAAARGAGVRHVVFLSLQGAERIPVVPHARVERWLKGSGLRWTFIRPSFFMQNLSTTHRSDVRDRGEITVPAGGGRTAFVDAHDVAALAAEVLRDPDEHAGRSWTPTGPAALTYDSVAADLSAVLGRTVRYTRPGALSYARHARRELSMPTGKVAVTTAIYTTARLGLAAGLTDDFRRVTGRDPVPLRSFAERERAAWEQPRRDDQQTHPEESR